MNRCQGRCGPGLLAVGLFALLGVAAGAGPAEAHTTTPGGVVSVAQSLGDREITVTMYLPAEGSGSMRVGVAARGPAPDATLRLQAVPGTVEGGATSTATVRSGSSTRTGQAALELDRPGPWQVVVDDGRDVARIPLTLVEPVVPGWVWAVRVGLGLAAVSVVAAAAMAGRRRPGVAAGLAGVTLVSTAVVVTAALLGGSVPAAATGSGGFAGPPGRPGAPGPGPDTAGAGMSLDMSGPETSGTGMSGMDMPGTGSGETGDGAIVLGLRTAPGTPVAGRPVELDLDLTDGSTGGPVDDLAVHDDALIHLAVIGPGGGLDHVHPVRVAPGRYRVRLTPPEAGRYAVFAEMERLSGGH